MAAPVHPRLAVSGLCFPELSALATIETNAGLGVAKASMTAPKLREAGAEAVSEACRRHGVQVVTVAGALGLDLSAGAAPKPQLQCARDDIDVASAVGASALYGLTGPRSMPGWHDSADAYAKAVGELVDYAADRNVVLALEPTNWLYADLNFVHSFHDALRIAPRAGMGICLDLFHVWMEAELHEEIKEHVNLISHVQLGDMVFGDRALPSRAVPGDGDVPLAVVVRWLVEAGYDGVFDLELNGPRIDAIGHGEAASRATAWLDELLGDVGA